MATTRQITHTNTVTGQQISPQVPIYIVADVPPVNPVGQLIYVSNEVGGATIAFSDGTNWRRVQDRSIIVSA